MFLSSSSPFWTRGFFVFKIHFLHFLCPVSSFRSPLLPRLSLSSRIFLGCALGAIHRRVILSNILSCQTTYLLFELFVSVFSPSVRLFQLLCWRRPWWFSSSDFCHISQHCFLDHNLRVICCWIPKRTIHEFTIVIQPFIGEPRDSRSARASNHSFPALRVDVPRSVAFQSILRKRIRKLPKILKIVKINI